MAITESKVENDFENKLLRRRELTVSLWFDGRTPSREEIRKYFADKLNLKHEHLVVVKAMQSYGEKMGSVLIHEYHDKDALHAAQKHLVSRPKAKKGKEAPAQTANASAPKEEAK